MMSYETYGITKGEIKRFLGKELEEFPPEQRDMMLQLLKKIKERSKQMEKNDDDDEPTLLL